MAYRQGETAFCALFLYVNEGGERFHQTPLYELFGKDQQFFLTDPISPFSKQILLFHTAEAPVFGKPEGGVRQGCLWARDASQRRAPASWRERRPWRQRGLWRIGGQCGRSSRAIQKEMRSGPDPDVSFLPNGPRIPELVASWRRFVYCGEREKR